MARARIHHWDADGDEGDVVGGGVAAVDGGVFVVVVVVRLVLDDHGAEGNGWKGGQYLALETFGLEMLGCPSAHA